MISDRDRIALGEAISQSNTNRVLFMARFARDWVLERLASSFPIPSWRAKLHRLRGINIGRNVYIGYDVIFDRIHPDLITTEDYVEIGDKSMISAYSRGSLLLRDAYPRETANVRIERGAWVAPGCIILQSVTIGERSVIGISSVVTKSIPPYRVAVGVPAKVVKKLNTKAGEKDEPAH